MKTGNICPHCDAGELEIVVGVHPYTLTHYQCNQCDSTYNMEEMMECPLCGGECKLEIYNFTDRDTNPGTEYPMWEPVVFCLEIHSDCPSFHFGLFGGGVDVDYIEERITKRFNRRV